MSTFQGLGASSPCSQGVALGCITFALQADSAGAFDAFQAGSADTVRAFQAGCADAMQMRVSGGTGAAHSKRFAQYGYGFAAS